MTHLSLLLIFGGAIAGNYSGFNGYVNIVEGKSVHGYHQRGSQEEKELGFHVALKKFTIDYDKDHNPISYHSDLTVREGDKAVAGKVIDVNHPLTYKGVSFFQANYGMVGVVVKIKAPNGEEAHVPFNINTEDTSQGKQYAFADEPMKLVKIAGKQVAVFAHGIAPDYVGGERINASFMPLNPAVQVMLNDRFPQVKAREAWTNLGWMTKSDTQTYKAYKVSLERVVNYTGLEVSKNPGLPIIYAGFILTLLGVFVSAYVTHKVIRVRVSPAQDGAIVTAGATSRGEDSIFELDFKRLRDALSASLR